MNIDYGHHHDSAITQYEAAFNFLLMAHLISSLALRYTSIVSVNFELGVSFRFLDATPFLTQRHIVATPIFKHFETVFKQLVLREPFGHEIQMNTSTLGYPT